MTSTFDLVTQPWLRPTWLPDGPTNELVGLQRLIVESHRIRRLVGDTPPQTIGLYRLILAVMHRAYRRQDSDGWARLWIADRLPASELQDYLDKWADRFDLFDTERPFLQCPGLRTLPPATVATLVPHRVTGNNTTLFDHTTATDRLTLAPAEAARWLVTLQNFDTGGLKTPFGKAGQRSSERGLLNRFGSVLVEGATLKETLLLNLLSYEPDQEMPTGTRPDDRPIWEWPAPPGPPPDMRFPSGWTDLLTWPARRVLLHAEQIDGQTIVDGAVITPGTALRPVGATGDEDAVLRSTEHMAAFGSGPRTYGRRKAEPMNPVRLERRRGVWRHTEDLLLPNDDRHQRPYALQEMARRVEDGVLDERAVYTLRVFGQQLDRSGGGTITAWFEQTVVSPVALLRAENETAGAIVGHAVALADGIGSALLQLERGFHTTMRGSTNAHTLDIGYWPSLPDPFDALLRGLGSAARGEDLVTPHAEDWARAVERAARAVVNRWAALPRGARQLRAVARCLNEFEDQMHGLVRAFRAHLPRLAPDGALT